MTYRYLGNTSDEDAITIKVTKQVPGLRNRILLDFFGKTDIAQVQMSDLTLPVHPGRVLKKLKLKSLAKKYFSIPDEYLPFYPAVSAKIKASLLEAGLKKKLKRQVKKGGEVRESKKRRVGRPKKALVPVKGLQSITKFFRVGKITL